MEYSKKKIKQIVNLMIIATALILVIEYSRDIVSGISFLIGILKPFIYGCVIAFILNIPLNIFEKKLFCKWKGKTCGKLKRPISIMASILMFLLIVFIIVVMVIPQIASSVSEIGRKLPVFMGQVQIELEHLLEDNQTLTQEIEESGIFDIQWNDVIEYITRFMKNGAGDILSSTFNVVGNIISGVVNGVISFVFAIYILSQKEKLGNQVKRVITAYLPDTATAKILKVCNLLYTNFTNFITGQCLEAVILGCLFVVCMSILQLPYAIVIGTLIALTALIPIVGAFIGCAVGVFLILIEDPFKAVIFIILFFVLQQIEGKLIYPKVVGNFVGLPGIWVFAAITVGGSLFGVIGMLVFIPLTATAYTLLREGVNKRNEQKKDKRKET